MILPLKRLDIVYRVYNNTITRRSIFLRTQRKTIRKHKEKTKQMEGSEKAVGEGKVFANGVRAPPRLLYSEFPLHLLLGRKKSRRKDNKEKEDRTGGGVSGSSRQLAAKSKKSVKQHKVIRNLILYSFFIYIIY